MLKHYLQLSLKVLRRRKFFTFISVFGISITLLVLMIATALLDQQIAPMAPETRQELTLGSGFAVMYGESGAGRNQWCCTGGFKLYDKYARNLPGAALLSIYGDLHSVFSYIGARKIGSQMKRTDGEFWQILEFTFLEGRPYSVAEVDRADLVAVINRATRERFFDGAPATGRIIDADGQRFRVVGVVENVPELRAVPYADIWTPHTTIRNAAYKNSIMGEFKAIVLAANREALPGIREEFNARLSRIDRSEFPAPEAYQTIVAPFETTWEQRARDVGPFTDGTDPEPQGWRVALAFTIIALMFTLLPTVNLVNINVSRIMERASEIGIRKAFGASSRTLVVQFVVENVILTVVGGLVGLVLSALVLRAINQSGVIAYSQLGVNWRVFAYGVMLAVIFGVISGVYPAWRMSRLHPAQALRGGGR